MKERHEHGFIRSRGFAVFVLLAALLTLANARFTVPYYVLSPGNTVGVTKYIQIPGDKEHKPRGDVLLTTVSLKEGHVSDIVWAWITPGNKIEKQQELLGNYSPEDYLKYNDEAMQDSKLVAESVAMRRAGYKVTQVGDGALVQQVVPQSPADGKIKAGETITAVNGVPVKLGNDASNLIRQTPPKNTVHLDVMDNHGGMRKVDITTTTRPDGQGAYVGVLISTKNARLDTPFPVSINTSEIGGPSAGLAFTLAMLDDLTPGELTGGKKVATTGTISLDGRVGPVGGVVQKTYAVNHSGAKLFLVPAEEFQDAKKTAHGDVKVVAVDTLDQALRALADNGGDVSGVPPAPAPAAVA